jgi:hypothetical protein
MVRVGGNNSTLAKPPKNSSMTLLLMFVASDKYFHIDFVSNMRKSSLIPLKT